MNQAAFGECADELDARLKAKVPPQEHAWQPIEAAKPGQWLVCYREGGMAVRWLRTSGKWQTVTGNPAGCPTHCMPLPAPPAASGDDDDERNNPEGGPGDSGLYAQ